MLRQLVEQLTRVPQKTKGRIIWNDGCRSRIYSKQYLTRRVYPFIVALITMVVITVVVITVVVITVVIITVVIITVVIITVVIITMVVIVMTVNVSKNLCFPLSILIHNLQIYLTLRQDSQFLHFKE